MKSNISCDCNIIHEAVVTSAKLGLPCDNDILSVANLFKVLGDGTRMKIVLGLLGSEMCVCDISALLNMTKSAISHQLAVLKKANIVASRRDGKAIYYSLNDCHVRDIITTTLEHIRHI